MKVEITDGILVELDKLVGYENKRYEEFEKRYGSELPRTNRENLLEEIIIKRYLEVFEPHKLEIKKNDENLY